MTRIIKLALITAISIVIIALMVILFINAFGKNEKDQTKGVYVYESELYQKRVC
jgi:hypothetical protein